MDLYSYVVARDFGFAPNPFYGFCTLATCKPIIRTSAKVGDVIIGVSNASLSKKVGYRGIVYTMIVDEKLSYDQYWSDSRFTCKKPILNGSVKQFYGDNIYHKENGVYVQENSHHSNEDGTTNFENYNRDTQSDYVLCSQHYWYWGRIPVEPPKKFSELLYGWIGQRRIVGRNKPQLVNDYMRWIDSSDETGIINFPAGFELGLVRYDGR